MAKRRENQDLALKGKPEIVRTVSANLELLMAREELGNRALAKLTNNEVSEGTIQRTRTGETAIQIDNLARLAKVFGLRPWQMLTENLDPHHPPQLTFPTARERDLYAKFKEFLESSK